MLAGVGNETIQWHYTLRDGLRMEKGIRNKVRKKGRGQAESTAAGTQQELESLRPDLQPSEQYRKE